MTQPEVTLVDGTAVFHLATGEKVRVSLAETSLGVSGFALKVLADRANLLVQPRAGNSLEIYTLRSMAAEAAEKDHIVATRDGAEEAANARR